MPTDPDEKIRRYRQRAAALILRHKDRVRRYEQAIMRANERHHVEMAALEHKIEQEVARRASDGSANRKPRRGSDPTAGGAPVKPNGPKTLSGGAAARIEPDQKAR